MDTQPFLPIPDSPAPHPFLLRVSQSLLAKAERSSATGPVRLSLDRKVAPELYDAVDADQIQLLRMQIDDLCHTGWVQLRLEAPRAFASFGDRKPKLELSDFDALAAWAGYTPRAQRWRQQWRAHLAEYWAATPLQAPSDPAAVLDHLARNPLLPVECLSVEEATLSITLLTALCCSGQPIALREASASVFQGRAKVLDHREELLRLLGAAHEQFADTPAQLLLAPPYRTAPDSDATAAFTEVLFIENLVTFEHMADTRGSAWADSLLIYAAGFRGSTRKLRMRANCRLYLRAPAPSMVLPEIERWLFSTAAHPSDGQTSLPVHFFGDLDYAGMQILASLREVFPHTQAWRPGFAPLAKLLESGAGHAPQWATKALQTDPGATGCAYADRALLPLLRVKDRFIDQEALDLNAIIRSHGSAGR